MKSIRSLVPAVSAGLIDLLRPVDVTGEPFYQTYGFKRELGTVSQAEARLSVWKGTFELVDLEQKFEHRDHEPPWLDARDAAERLASRHSIGPESDLEIRIYCRLNVTPVLMKRQDPSYKLNYYFQVPGDWFLDCEESMRLLDRRNHIWSYGEQPTSVAGSLAEYNEPVVVWTNRGEETDMGTRLAEFETRYAAARELGVPIAPRQCPNGQALRTKAG